ncbi:MAG: phosphatase PAP2 family protein [bacterium]|nr:phosphatase PAP2 family protein [bacterium]
MFSGIINKINNADIQVVKAVSAFEAPVLLNRFMSVISISARGGLYLAASAFLLIYDLHQAKYLIPAGLIAFVILLLIQKPVKNLFKRKRPGDIINGIKYKTEPPSLYSFPSGHSGAAFMMAAVFSYFYPAGTPFFYVYASLAGFSRVYDCVHYPTDVLAGAVLGFLTGQVGLFVVSFLFRSF